MTHVHTHKHGITFTVKYISVSRQLAHHTGIVVTSLTAVHEIIGLNPTVGSLFVRLSQKPL